LTFGNRVGNAAQERTEMRSWIDLITLAADEAAEGGVDPLTKFIVPMLPWAVILFLMYWLLLRPQKKEQQRKQEMLSNLKKNDRVVTIGGIIGTVANVDSDAGEVTIKVDQNMRLKVRRSAIETVDRNNGETSS